MRSGEIRESTTSINQITGVKPYLFALRRIQQYGFRNPGRRVIYTIMWSVDTLDWAGNNHGRMESGSSSIPGIIDRVLNSASANGIVLMHIGGPSTVEALPRIIEGLRNQGYTFATVYEMLPKPETGPIYHTVKSGETLYSIAKRYGVGIEEIIAYNQLDQ